MFFQLMRFILATMLILFLSGCASSKPKCFVNIDSIGHNSGKIKYVLLSGLKNIDNNDLQFKEYERYIDKALKKKGFIKGNFENAEIAIFLSYGISDPQKNIETYSVPVWGKTGVSSSTTYGNSHTCGTLNTYGNMGNYQGNTYSRKTTYHTPTYGVVGYRNETMRYTTFTRYFQLNAIDLKDYKLNKKQTHLWITTVRSTGANGNLREIFPILVAASNDFIATNTGKRVQIILTQDDSRVLEIKGVKKPK